MRLALRPHGRIQVFGVDKFPRMTDYVVPTGVRIADADRVRLGAYLAEGTTVMHEGFVNYNAGTLGPSMVEGRISAGVVVDSGSDVGGGASIMGTLVGRRERSDPHRPGLPDRGQRRRRDQPGRRLRGRGRLLRHRRIEGLLADGTSVKAVELSGRPGLQYWRNSLTGALEARARDLAGNAPVELNAALHTNE